MSRIFVTGMGVISSIGDSVAENRVSLIAGKCGISTLEMFHSKYSGILPVGEIKTSTKSLKEKLNVDDPGITRTTLLALKAFNEAIEDAGISASQVSSMNTALVGASTVGGMCLTDELYHDANKDSDGSEYVYSYDCGSVNMYIQAKYCMQGIVNTINTACSSSANAIMYGARLIKNGMARRAIVGGADSLAKFTVNGFNALHILSPDTCVPFDRDRKGLNLGEGAAFLVLEMEEDIAGKKVYAEISGYSNTNDAFHPSSLSETGEGPFLAMQQALYSAKLIPGDINFINAHGTGTENNDEVESRAMLRLFKTPPAFASTKSCTGHTLGAAGAMEAVFSVLSLAYNELYPVPNFNNPIPGTGLVPNTAYIKMPLKHIMTNSFGFGGNCSSLIFSQA